MGLTKPRAAQIFNLDYKQATRVVTTTNITLTGGAPSLVDGVTLSLNDRVLVTGQSTGSQNGLYVVTTVGSGANGTWARTSDGNETGEIEAGMIVMVTEGTIYADTQWKLITDNPIVIGSTTLTFTQNYSANSISGGTSNVTVYSNANVTISSAGTANVLLISSTGTVTSGTASVTGNVTGGNVLTGGLVSATGNVTGNYILGNGASLTGVITSVANINNGTSNVTVVSSGGDVTVGIGGTGNIAVFSTSGLDVTGKVSATGNITGGNILGNGAGLTGINTFSSLAVTGSNTITANSIATGLTFTGDTSIVITANTTTNTVSFAFGGSGESIFATGGDMGLVTEAATVEEDLGLITDAVTESYDLGGFFLDGLVSNDNFLLNSINGNILTTNAVISTTGNITASYFVGNGSQLTGVTASLSGNLQGNINGNGFGANAFSFVSATGNMTGSNLISTGAVYSNFNTNTANTASFNATGGNTKGGTGYLDFLVAQNTSGGATNPFKWFRTNSTGGLEIINSAYNNLLLSLTDAGALSVASSISVAGKKAVNGPAFRAYIDIGQAITSGSQQKVTFGTETFDTDGNFASSRFTPTTEGYYQLNSTVRIAGGSSTGEYMLVIWKNGAEYSRGSNGSGTEIGASFYSLQVSDIAYANGTGDYFEIYIQQTSGSNKDTTAGAQISYFSGVMVRGA